MNVRSDTVSRLTIRRTTMGLVALAVLTAGCGQIAERATEEAAERAVESESGENVDIDIDDGSFSIETEDGGITFSADGDGVSIEGSDEGGQDFSLDARDDGLEIDGVDGESVYDAGDGIPDEWPSDVPRPEGLSDIFGTYVSEGSDESVLISGSSDADATDVFDDYVARLADAGFDETSASDQGIQLRIAAYTDGDRTVTVTAQSSDGRTDLIVVVGST